MNEILEQLKKAQIIAEYFWTTRPEVKAYYLLNHRPFELFDEKRAVEEGLKALFRTQPTKR